MLIIIASGLLAGFGTRLGDGCTGGHAVRFDWPSGRVGERCHT